MKIIDTILPEESYCEVNLGVINDWSTHLVISCPSKEIGPLLSAFRNKEFFEIKGRKEISAFNCADFFWIKIKK